MDTFARFPSPLWSAIRLAGGILEYSIRGSTPPAAYHSLISLFCQGGGASNDLLSRFISVLYPLYQFSDARGVLGDFDESALNRITHQLDEHGFYIFERGLTDDLVDRLLDFALTQRCIVRPMSESAPKYVERYERQHPAGVRYDFDTQDVINNLDVQRLMVDHSILAIAQSYLRCKPIIDVMGMWWHTSFSKTPDKEAAQFWHFDMDRIKWLKFFIYLTDVKADNGPHCFVKGSHRTGGIPDPLRRKGYVRLTDEEVQSCYAPDRFMEFTAPRGTVIAEDTRGLHKGKHLNSGDRLVLQLQFSNSLFGGLYPKSRFSRCSEELKDGIARYKRLYSAYL